MNAMTSVNQELPNNIEAEQQVLGALLNDNSLAYKITGKLKAEQFYDPVHQRIFANLIGRINADKLASMVTLKEDMASDEGLAQLGGVGYLAKLAGHATASFAIADYAQSVAEMKRRRELLEICDGVRARINADESASVSVADLELFLHRQEPEGEPRSMSLIKAHTQAIQDAVDIQSGKITAIPTGLSELDEALRLARGRYTILGGSTSMGKTALALWITRAAAREGFGVGFVSREMPERDLAARMNSIDSQIPYKAFDRPMSQNTLQKVTQAAKGQEFLPVEIFSARVDDMPSILSEAKKLKHKWQPNGNFKGLGLLVIDSIQLIKGKGNNFEVLSAVANDLKQVAKDLDVHVLALAQIDRKMLESEDARPKLSHLRGSGDLENAPDNVVFCFREEYFLQRKTRPTKTEELADFIADLEASKGKMEIIIGKARMGEVGTVTVGCDMGTNRFWNLATTQDMEF